MKMFDRKAYGQRYSREKRERRKAEGRCVTCGVKLTFKCTTLQCEHCREKQKYQNVAKVNISKLIAEARAEARADTVRKMQDRLKDYTKDFRDKFEMVMLPYTEAALVGFERTIDQIAKEMLEVGNGAT
jgi:hypothetical protein